MMMLLFITTLVTIGSLAGYFLLISSQSHNVGRSQSWNAAIPTTEAGIEEAMEHLNRNCISNYINGGVLAYTADGWMNTNYDGKSGIAKLSQVFGASSVHGYDVVIWTNDLLHPVIEATGYSPAAQLNRPGGPMLATVGLKRGFSTIARNVRVITDPIYVYSKALLTKGPLNLNGNNVTIDSFDPSVTPGGIYSTNYRNAKGNIATAQITNALSVGNANVYGTVSTPYGGSVSVEKNGSVGSVDWQNNGSGGIEPGWSRDDLNVAIDPAKLPQGFNPIPPTLSGVSFTNVVTNFVSVTNSAVTTYPTGYDFVITNTSDITSSSFPSGVPYTGTVQTNTVLTTTAKYPSADTFIGSVSTNVLQVSTSKSPSAGTFVGKVTTNILSFSNEHALPIEYVPGTLVISGSSKNPKYAYSQYQYVYFSVVGFTYNLITGYTYHRIDSYAGVKFSSPVTVTNVATYQYVFPTGDWVVDSITSDILVTGAARVRVNYDISLSGHAAITVNPGASLILYMAGESADMSGNGVVNNNPDARSFSYVGLPSNKHIKLSGNASFTGTFYAPQADLQLAGGGKDTMDFVGAAVVDSVWMNGHFHLHYPENLAKAEPISGYVVKNWQEY